MSKGKQKLTLYIPTAYQIKVPGTLDQTWSGWVDGMAVMVEEGSEEMPITTISGFFDQAALLGLLRLLYSQGLPLISVTWVDAG